MKTGKIVRYVIESSRLVLILLLEDGTEVKARIDSSIAITLGDDIFHALYAGTDDEGKPIHKMTRTLDPASGHFLDSGDEIEYEPEASEE
jgi:hypothetical protein